MVCVRVRLCVISQMHTFEPNDNIISLCMLLLLYYSWAKMITYPCIVVLLMFSDAEYLNIITFLRLAY